MASIDAVGAREILDSRGNPTVEVEVAPRRRHGRPGRGARGASTGAFEAVELRDGDEAATAARASRRPCSRSLDEIGPELVGYEASEQRLIDQALLDLDGTPNKSRARRQRDPRRLARRGAGRRRVRRACRCSATSAARTRTCCRCR